MYMLVLNEFLACIDILILAFFSFGTFVMFTETSTLFYLLLLHVMLDFLSYLVIFKNDLYVGRMLHYKNRRKVSCLS